MEGFIDEVGALCLAWGSVLPASDHIITFLFLFYRTHLISVIKQIALPTRCISIFFDLFSIFPKLFRS